MAADLTLSGDGCLMQLQTPRDNTTHYLPTTGKEQESYTVCKLPLKDGLVLEDMRHYCAELLTVNNPEGLARAVDVMVLLAAKTLSHPLHL